MLNLKRQFLMSAFRTADVAVMALAFTWPYLLRRDGRVWTLNSSLPSAIKFSNILLFVGFAIIWHLIFCSQGLYRSRRIGLIKVEWWDVTKAVVLGALFLSAVTLLFKISAINRTFLVTFFALVYPATLAMRSGFRFFLGGVRERGRNLRNAVIVGCGPRGALIGRELRNRPDLGYLLLGYIDDIPAPQSALHNGSEKLLGSLAELEGLLQTEKVDEVFVALPVKSYYETIDRVIALGAELGLMVRIPADSFEFRLAKANIDYLDDAAFLTLRGVHENLPGLVHQADHRRGRLRYRPGRAPACLYRHSNRGEARFPWPRVLCPGTCWFKSKKVSRRLNFARWLQMRRNISKS